MVHDFTKTVKDIVLNHVEKVMEEHKGNKEQARLHLGIARSTLYRYLDQIRVRNMLKVFR